ncbi:hypothetical protein [Microbacterium sp.]|uniref:hypothetical protein n=1 Tax=Microbacterium sp. TaxID=51671 RepID=UPI003A85DE34
MATDSSPLDELTALQERSRTLLAEVNTMRAAWPDGSPAPRWSPDGVIQVAMNAVGEITWLHLADDWPARLGRGSLLSSIRAARAAMSAERAREWVSTLDTARPAPAGHPHDTGSAAPRPRERTPSSTTEGDVQSTLERYRAARARYDASLAENGELRRRRDIGSGRGWFVARCAGGRVAALVHNDAAVDADVDDASSDLLALWLTVHEAGVVS